MKKIKYLWIVLVLLLLSENLLIAETDQKSDNTLLRHAMELYQDGEYSAAIEMYNELLESNYTNFEIFYNLGNCYYKTENFTSAILNYEKAKRISPADADVNFNLKLANMQIIDKIKPIPQVFYRQWYNTISNIMPANAWAIFTMVCFWLIFILLSIFALIRSAFIKRLSFALSVFFIGMTIISFAISYDVQARADKHNCGIIFAESVYVKSSPDEESKNLFILHNGTRVEIFDKINSWVKIRLSDGNQGWIENTTFERI